MRIVCEKCAAAYAVEDRLVSARGVRTQCPRCMHVQRTMPPGSAPGAAPSGSTPAGATPASQKVPVPSGSTPAGATRATAAQTPAASGPARPDGAAVATAPAGTSRATARAPEATAQPAPGGSATCRSCGTPLTDPFDVALGVCDRCRQAPEGITTGSPPTPRHRPPPTPETSAPAAVPYDEGALELDRTPIRGTRRDPLDVAGGGATPPPMRMTPTGQRTPPPMRQTPAPQRTGSGPGQVPDAEDSGARTAANEVQARSAPLKVVERPPSRWPMILAALAGIAVAIAIAAILKLRQQQPPPAPAIPPVLEATLARWRMLYIDLPGTADQHLANGLAKMREDDPLAYAEAEESFQQALLLEPQRRDALVGYVQAVARGRTSTLDAETFEEANALIDLLLARPPREADALTARAELLLARPQPDVETARRLAEEALTRADDTTRPSAQIALGRTYQSTSSELALQHLGDALSGANADPRAYYFRALAQEAAGNYRAAIADLRQRLAVDGGHLPTLEALARLYQEGGDTQNANATYVTARKQHPENALLAVQHLAFGYQTGGSLQEAANGLRVVLRDAADEPRAAAEASLHLATVERLRQNLRAAREAADRAAKLRPGPAAGFQRLLIAQAARDFATAEQELNAVRGHLGDTGLEKLLEGRLRLAQQRFGEAQAACRAAFDADPRRIDGLLCAGVAAARASKRDDAFRQLYQAATADPERSAPSQRGTRFFLRPGETLEGLEGHLLALAADDADVQPFLYEGHLLYRLGRFEDAERRLARATRIDDTNALAWAYRSLAALAQGDRRASLRHAERGGVHGKRVAVTRLAAARALAANGRAAPAEEEVRAALELAPALSSGEVLLAELQAKRGDGAAARTVLLRALAQDPTHLKAKQALYELDADGAKP